MDNAQTIQHLGGFGPLQAMVNARNFTAGDNELRFRFTGSRKVNVAVVRMTSDDLYTLELYRVRTGNWDLVATAEGLYADMLRGTFERETGLYLSL